MAYRGDFINGLHPKLSYFDLSNENKLTCNMGSLIPIAWYDCLPGDRFKIANTALVRLQPQLAPVMHNVKLFVHWWKVPYRLLWSNWENFITGGEDGKDASVSPYIYIDGEKNTSGNGTLADYLGLPAVMKPTEKVSVLPFRAYNLIWNEWYRDQNLQEKRAISLGDGEDTTTDLSLAFRCWLKDYFTNSLPWPQRGAEVTLPLGTSAPVRTGDDNEILTNEQPLRMRKVNESSAGLDALYAIGINSDSDSNTVTNTIPAASSSAGLNMQIPRNLYADLSDATAATIRQIRLAFQTQKFFERNARCGARYVEQLQAHFGVRARDSRLQLPEFCGGASANVVFSEVLQTSETNTSGTPQANMAGHGFSAMNSNIHNIYCEEHCIIMGILSVMPTTAYMQGIARKWTRETKFDYAFPEFQHIGEQAVLNKEIYANASEPDGVFGYQGRYQEYRECQDEVHGDFRGNLDYWHLAREFDNEPALNSDFVTCKPSKRIFAVTDEKYDSLLVDVANHVHAYRPISKRGEPGFVDHN